MSGHFSRGREQRRGLSDFNLSPDPYQPSNFMQGKFLKLYIIVTVFVSLDTKFFVINRSY